MDISRTASRIQRVLTDNSPMILTAIGVTGTITTAYLTGKASVEAADHLRMYEDFEGVRPEGREVIELVWKIYIPPVTVGLLTVSAIIASNRLQSNRTAALAAAYSISEKAYTEYKNKITQKIGESKEQNYRDEIAQERVDKDPVEDASVIVTGNGDVLCYDQFSSRYFMSQMEAIRQVENDINYQILHDGYASLSEFYHALDIPSTGFSEDVGWNTDHSLTLRFSTAMSEDKRPCIVIDFEVHPEHGFNKFG